MLKVLFPPEHPLNPAIKQQLLKTLTRTDIYITRDYDQKTKICTLTVRDFRDSELIEYIHDEINKTHTIKQMGIEVAKMLWRKTMLETRQHKDIFDIKNTIESKRDELQKKFDALKKMSEAESLSYQLAQRAMENARYE